MKTIGLIGGMSWHSSLEYYRIINEEIQKRLGGWNSAKILMYSVNFEEIDLEHQTDNWEQSDQLLINAAKTLENGGADCVVMCANTAHILFNIMQESLAIPVLHIADATAEKIKQKGASTVGLLGTNRTAQSDFYVNRLKQKHNINIVVPDANQQETIHKEICNLCLGKINSDTKRVFINTINALTERGAEAVILGCTEISLVVQENDTNIPLFDTTKIHAQSAVEFALSQ